MNPQLRRRFASAALIVGFFLAWELLCVAFGIKDIVLPRPSQIVVTLAKGEVLKVEALDGAGEHRELSQKEFAEIAGNDLLFGFSERRPASEQQLAEIQSVAAHLAGAAGPPAVRRRLEARPSQPAPEGFRALVESSKPE